ncbi:hypothetical protein C8R47DRAFT_1227865 [Mycena vitilis]|nr:hypothetical protein C8R47DRAFT_1227865 [Mycena vitilis]
MGTVFRQATRTGVLHINSRTSFADKLAAYRSRAASSLGPTPMTGTATSLQSPNKGIFTGAPLGNAPLPMPRSATYANANANTHTSPNMLSTPFQPGRGHEGAHPEMPAPFYARRRTDPERSARIGTSGKSRLGNRTDDSPGWTPPGVRCDRGKFACGEGGGSGSGPSGEMQGQGTSTRARTALRQSCRSGWFSAMGGKSSAGEVDPAPEREEKEKRGVASPLPFGGKALPPTPASAESPAHAPPHVILALLREPSNILRPPLARVTDGVCDSLCQSAHHRRPCLQGPLDEARPAQTPKRPRCRRPISFPAGLVEDEEQRLTVDDAGGAQGVWAEEARVSKPSCAQRCGCDRIQAPRIIQLRAGEGRCGQIEKGSSKALMNELVFATVFLRAETDAEEAAQREKQWLDYARAALLCLPLLIGRARACRYLVAGAAPEEIESQCARVACMAREHLALHGAREDFRRDPIPDVTFPSTQPVTSGLPASASTRAMYAPSPVGNPAARMVCLLDAHGMQEPQSPPGGALPSLCLQQPGRGLTSQMPWVAIETEGLAIDPHRLTLFHRAVLETRWRLVAAVIWERRGAALFHNLLLVQILGSDTTTQTPGGEQQGTSRTHTHSRSEVISVCARVGELSRAADDECAWRAIVAALCSGPVARLDKVWRRSEGPALQPLRDGRDWRVGELCDRQQWRSSE